MQEISFKENKDYIISRYILFYCVGGFGKWIYDIYVKFVPKNMTGFR